MLPRRPYLVLGLLACFGTSGGDGWVTLPSDYVKYKGAKYAWTIAPDPLSDLGLSGGLAFAIDPAFCAQIRPEFREDVQGAGSLNLVQWVTCADINDAIARAMNTWSANHPYIHFYNVTDECIAEDNGRDCGLAEVYIDARLPAAGLEALAAFVVHNPSWRNAYSNGEQWEMGVRLPSGDTAPLDWQIKFATITFHTHLCWYLDNTFCSGLRASNESGNMRLVCSGVIFGVWAVSFLHLFYLTGRFLWLACRLGLVPGVQRILIETSKWMLPNYLCIFCLVAPPIVWFRLLLPCLECFDFEATAAHELGHVLGFAHPDTSRNVNRVALRQASAATCCLRASFPESKTFSWMSELNCSSGGLATDAVGFDESDPSIEDSVMFHLTTFKSRACLSPNDLAGLQYHYPLCNDDLIHMSEPMCVKSKRNLGWVRLLEAVVIPFVLASLVFFISVHLASRQLRARTNHDRWELGAQKAVQRGKQRRLGRRALLKSKQGRKGLGNPGPTPAEGGRGRGGGGEREAAPGEDLPRADWSSAWEVGSGSHEVPSSASVSPGSSLANSTLSATDGPSGPDRPPTPPGTGFAPPGRPPPPGKQPALAGQWPTAAPPPQTKQTAPVFPGAAAAAAVAAGGTRGRDYCAQTWAARASTELRVAAGAGEGAGGAMLPLLDLRPHPDIINSTNDISRLVGGCATPLPRELPHRAAPVLPAQAPEPDGEHPDLDPSAGLFSV